MDHSRAATENKVVASFLVADYNIKFEPESCFSMKRALWPTTRQISVQAKRLVTFVLLAGIAYSVTFGSAHRHTDPTQQLSANSTADIVIGAAIGPLASNAGSIDDQDCLICRFHQQLFNSVVHARLLVSEPEMRRLHSPYYALYSYANLFISTSVGRPSGRAPPLV
jgi:hypothetical protein